MVHLWTVPATDLYNHGIKNAQRQVIFVPQIVTQVKSKQGERRETLLLSHAVIV